MHDDVEPFQRVVTGGDDGAMRRFCKCRKPLSDRQWAVLFYATQGEGAKVALRSLTSECL